MELVLTGRNFSAQEAEKWGVVSRVVGEGEGEVVKEAIEMAKVIAAKGRVAVMAGKEVVNAGRLSDSNPRAQRPRILRRTFLFEAYELTLAEGLHFERRTFHGLFATHDQKEGMAAFAEKRKAQFTGK
jgi:enoyl-CoA hydratase